ncbi:MAG: lipopolysaccharide biosynthesis protein [Bacteroidales bacterium]|nr:lipopolysaccharide biosynthesis protein [Bacteroidales bacterium]
MTKEISQKSRRVARNTVLLYFRMLLLMFIGLFTSRIVLKSLGVEDFGTYNVVYSIVMMFSVLSNSISSSIQRYFAYSLGKGETDKLKKLFSNALLIQGGLTVLLLLVAETLGVWYLENRAVIPAGRENAAMWAFQCSVVLLAIQLFSIPFNCAIIAHEDMKAYAWISLLEGTLKLAVALALYVTSADKLIIYSILMVCVAIINRGTYAYFCHRNYEETRGRLVFDRECLKSMISFGAWSFTAQGVGVFNTQGVNILNNSVFGVRINAARGIAGQVENIVRQFVSNFLTALNPLVIKTWADSDKDYCFAMVRKGCKFSYLIVLMFAVPFIFESEAILSLWLGTVPGYACTFTRLAVLTVLADMMSNTLAQLIMANGKISTYFLVTSSISAFTFLGTWIAFSMGAGPEYAYAIAIIVFVAISAARLLFSARLCAFPVGTFFKEVVLPLAAVTVLAIAAVWSIGLAWHDGGLLESAVRIICSLIVVAVSTYFIALTPGEKTYIRNLCRRK